MLISDKTRGILADSGLIDPADSEECSSFAMKELKYLRAVHETWNSLACRTLVLGWDKNAGRFYVKGRLHAAYDLNFTDFIKRAATTSPYHEFRFYQY